MKTWHSNSRQVSLEATFFSRIWVLSESFSYLCLLTTVKPPTSLWAIALAVLRANWRVTCGQGLYFKNSKTCNKQPPEIPNTKMSPRSMIDTLARDPDNLYNDDFLEMNLSVLSKNLPTVSCVPDRLALSYKDKRETWPGDIWTIKLTIIIRTLAKPRPSPFT